MIKIHGGQYQQNGIPDLILCHEGNFLALEVKLPNGDYGATKLQEHTIREIREAGGIARVVTSVEEAEEALNLLTREDPEDVLEGEESKPPQETTMADVTGQPCPCFYELSPPRLHPCEHHRDDHQEGEHMTDHQVVRTTDRCECRGKKIVEYPDHREPSGWRVYDCPKCKDTSTAPF